MFLNSIFSHENLEYYRTKIIEKTYEYPLAALVSTIALGILGFNGVASYSIMGAIIGLVQLLTASVSGYHMLKNRTDFQKLTSLAIQYHRAEEKDKGQIQVQTNHLIAEIMDADKRERERSLEAKFTAIWLRKANKPKANPIQQPGTSHSSGHTLPPPSYSSDQTSYGVPPAYQSN